MIVLFVKWFVSDVFEEIELQGDMKLQFISVVAAFLLCLVTAERNGPTYSQLTLRRRFNKSYRENHPQRSSGGRSILNITNENLNIARRLPSTFKVTGISKTPKIPQRKFPGLTTPKNPSVNIRGYARSQRSETKTPRNFSATKFHQARRSLDLGIKSNHLPVPKITLEPILYQKAKASFFGHPILADFSPDLNDILGPLIGPLNLPGIGKSVHIRLMVPPDEEATSHVTVHLVKKGPVESFSDIHESPGSGHHEKPKPLFSGEKSIIFAPIPPEELTASVPINPQRNRPVEKSVYALGLTPPQAEYASRPYRVQNHREIPHQEMPNNQPAQFANPQQYFAAPNHHELPIADRPVENLINLPIYPPLLPHKFKDEKAGDTTNRANVSADTQTSMDMPSDTQPSASLKHTMVYRNHLTSPTAWRAIRISVLPEPELISNRREFPQPVFVQEITPPDLSSGNISRQKSKDALVRTNGRKYTSRNLHLRNNSAAPAALEDKHLALGALNYSLRHTTTSRTMDLFSHHTRPGEHGAVDDHDGMFRSTTSNVLLNRTDRTTLKKMKRIH